MNNQQQPIKMRGQMLELMGTNRTLKDKLDTLEYENNDLKNMLEDYKKTSRTMLTIMGALRPPEEDSSDYITTLPTFNNVTRFEVIDDTGRAYTKRFSGKIEFSRQDDGKTLKIFLNNT